MEELQKNSVVKILALGAGQEVGRSCVVVTIKDKKIVFDSGIHMLYSDNRRYPDFGSLYTSPKTINDAIDLVLITHFHLDHCGGLPYLTQFHKYNGPIYASTPTKAMIPFMLEDFRKVTSDVKKQQNQFYVYSAAEVKSSSSKIQSIGLFETLHVNGIKITSYYAGHVLGACMFYVEYDGISVMYTGDYNSYADRHLGAASAPRLNPNVIITETTYATTIRDTKRDRQRNMLKIISQTLENGGKVLIPVFALGRAQELSVLLETYWNRTDNNIPIYYSAGLIEKANVFYKLFVDWENQKIKEEFSKGENVFEFKKVKPFDKSLIRAETPYVLFATPGMLHGGTSMQVFKQWCGDQKNTLIIPGYCVEGTLGNKLLKGMKQIVIDKKSYEVKMKIANVSFSAHADAKGIINLIRNLNAENIVFVHGDKQKMEIFSEIVEEQLQKKVYMPANFKQIQIKVSQRKEIKIVSQNGHIYPRGYLIKDNSHINQYILVKEQRLLQEVNQMMQLMGDSSGYIMDSHIQCRFHLHKPDITNLFKFEALKQKYQHQIRFIDSEEIQIKEEQVKIENQTIKEEHLEGECSVKQAQSNQILMIGEIGAVVEFLEKSESVRTK